MAWVACRVRQCIPLCGEGPARGAALQRPLRLLDNAVILARGSVVESVESWSGFRPPAGTRVVDLGDLCLVPGLINAHCHLQLSSVAGKTLWHAGFVPWLRSLISLLGQPLLAEDLARAVLALRQSGTICVGDYTSHGLPAVRRALLDSGLDAVHFCEHFGFDLSHLSAGSLPDAAALPYVAGLGGLAQGILTASLSSALGTLSAYPPGVAALLNAQPALRAALLAPAGHALYSTHAELLRRAHDWCCQAGRPFSIHLAESAEEDEALTKGSGPLVDLYAERVLPADWRAPGLRPVPAAEALGLLGPGTLAVHGVHCSPADSACLANTGTSLCLCPRSNAVLGVGRAPLRQHRDAGVLLCLGTDGLSSAPSLDLWEEARLLREQDAEAARLPALLRMLTVNGAAALGRSCWGTLERGKGLAFAVLPADFAAQAG